MLLGAIYKEKNYIMNHLDNYDYGSITGFVSTTKQINNHMDSFREANKAALDRNTAAINHQTDVLERVFTEHTNRTEAIISAQTVNQNKEIMIALQPLSPHNYRQTCHGFY